MSGMWEIDESFLNGFGPWTRWREREPWTLWRALDQDGYPVWAITSDYENGEPEEPFCAITYDSPRRAVESFISIQEQLEKYQV